MVLRILVAVVVSVGVAYGGSSTVAVPDSSRAAVMSPAVPKALSVPKPKTNWSKIKELFM